MVEIMTKRQTRIFIQEEVERRTNTDIKSLIDTCFERIQLLNEDISILQQQIGGVK